MAPRLASSTPNTGGSTDDWATTRVSALPDVWFLIARHSGLVGAWRLTGVCTAARARAKVEWLRGARRVWRIYCQENNKGSVAAESIDTAMGTHACSRQRTLWTRVLRGEGRPRRPRWTDARSRVHLECGDTFEGKGVRGAPTAVMRWDPCCSRHRGERERQQRGASAPAQRGDVGW